MKKELLIFTRYPEPGKTKTRLVPALGNNGAADIHRQMAELTVSMATTFAKNHDCAVTIFYQGGSLDSMINWLGPLAFQEQCQGDLGQRFDSAFTTSFLARNEAVVAIGTDCPDLKPDTLDMAFKALEKTDSVLGPALDGGYYLIGLGRQNPELFTDIDWGTESVLSQTLQKINKKQLTSVILEPLHDIDRPEDIKYFSHYSHPE